HLASSIFLVGGAVMIVMAGQSDRPTARRWERRTLAVTRALAVVALASGLVALSVQTALFQDPPGAALALPPTARVVVETQAGHVWLVRFGLLVTLAVFLLVRLTVDERVDWRAARGEGALLGAAALVPIAAAGHAAAVEPGTARAIALDALHVLAAGGWGGGLVPPALPLRAPATIEGRGAPPLPRPAGRRVSSAALACVAILAVSGALLATVHVGSVAGLVGTRYGRLLLAKLLLLALALVLALVNRSVLLARLGGDGATIGRPAMRRLSA